MPSKPAISTQLHPHENLQQTSHTRAPSPETPACHPRKSTSGIFSQTSASISPSIRYPLTRPLSPDLPTRDALYLFCNFSSYMRSPHEGAEGIRSSEDFRDTIRLLDYSRSLAASPQGNVHILHLKYRFQGQSQSFRSSTVQADYPSSTGTNEAESKMRNPVPQPFSVLHDPIVKIDYKENGVFEPLPAQAVFSHVAKCCQPPPRIIVVSYVCSKVTQNHLAALSTWALASSPPAYIFSPLETRIRETQPLHLALHHAIPMSMYAWPAEASPCIPPRLLSPSRAAARQISQDTTGKQRRLSAPCAGEGASVPEPVGSGSQQEKQYPPAPVASLIVTSAPSSSRSGVTVPPPVDRIPLWALAPGVGVLHGSTSACVGVRLGDFSALNLEDEQSRLGASGSVRIRNDSFHRPKTTGQSTGTSLDSYRLRMPLIAPPFPPIETPARPITPYKALTRHVGVVIPVKQASTHLSPTDTPGSIPISQKISSWPSPLSEVLGWRKGRKEQMEDTLEQLGCGVEAVDLADKLEALFVPDEEKCQSEIGDIRHEEGKAYGKTARVVDLL